MRFFHHLRQLIRFMQLPESACQVAFYAESKNAWPDLEDLILTLLNTSSLSICYFTSDKTDPGLTIKNPRYHSFNIDEGFIRNWLFENIKTSVFVMTTPDLHQYQLKRSKYPVHYIYVQHSLVSLHSVYRKGAFDHFDTIFCAGQHHINEIRAMEAYYQLPAKNLIEHGYPRLDRILESCQDGFVQSQKRPSMASALPSSESRRSSTEQSHPDSSFNQKTQQKKILIAPTWGKQGAIESGLAYTIIDDLLELGHGVILRPHPETRKLASSALHKIQKQYEKHPNFHLETHIADTQSLFTSDIMISDWSGAALDYAFGVKKPVIFLDIPQKINNPDYALLEIEPFEKTIRESVGTIICYNDLINHTVDWNKAFNKAEKHFSSFTLNQSPIFSVGHSAEVGTNFIKNYITHMRNNTHEQQ